MLSKATILASYLVVAAAMLALVGCAQEVPTTYAQISLPTLNLESDVPSPQNAVVLNVTGANSTSNYGSDLMFDMDMLEALGLVEYSIADPWQDHQQVRYTGVLMNDILKYSGADATATQVHLVALDDYAVDISIADIQKWPIMLATRKNGTYMAVDNSGPTMVVFPFHAYPEIDEDTYKVLMVWNLKEIGIR